jgi:hydrogenase/urease accessory protein HupE
MNGARLVLAYAASLGLAGSAAAHPGHGPDATSVLHYLAEPVHAPVILAVIVLVSFGALILGRRRARRPVVRSAGK